METLCGTNAIFYHYEFNKWLVKNSFELMPLPFYVFPYKKPPLKIEKWLFNLDHFSSRIRLDASISTTDLESSIFPKRLEFSISSTIKFSSGALPSI